MRLARCAAWVGVAVGMFGGCVHLPAQDTSQGAPPAAADGARRGQFAGMQNVMGEVTAVAGSTISIKTPDNHTVEIVTTDNTRLMKDRGPIKASDLHQGDGLVAFGNLDAPNHTLHAAMVMAQDAAQVKAMRENLGKTYITGRVTAINLDNAKMTVERVDHVAQTIAFDETTSFKRSVRGNRGGGASGGNGPGNGGAAGGNRGDGSGASGRGPGFNGGGMGMGGGMGTGNLDRAFGNGESITLADIKVGDFIAGTGSVKNGSFVPTRVVDSPPGQRRMHSEGGSAPTGADSNRNAGNGPAQP